MLQRNTAPKTSPRHHSARALRALVPVLAAGIAGIAVACADGPTAPAAAPAAASAPTQAFVPGPHAALLSPVQTVVGLIPSLVPTLRDSVMQITVDPKGSTFTDKDAAITVRFPDGFVARPTTFTITRKAGAVVGYDFQPSGTFSKPVTVTIKLDKTAWALTAGLLPVQGAYVRNWSQVGQSDATVDELVPTTVDAKAKTATLTLSHFSGYLMSTGRR